MRITCLPIDSQQLVEPSGLVGKGDLERVPEMMHKGEYLCTPQIGENQQPAACRSMLAAHSVVKFRLNPGLTARRDVPNPNTANFRLSDARVSANLLQP